MFNFRKIPVPEIPSLFERQLKNLDVNSEPNWWDSLWSSLNNFAQKTDAWNMTQPDLPGSYEEWRDKFGLYNAGDRPVGPLPLLLTDQPQPIPNYFNQLLQFRPPTFDRRGLDVELEELMRRFNKGPVI